MADSAGKWFGANTAAGAYQAVVGIVVLGILTAVFGWLKGLQFYWAVLFGVAVTVGLALAANLVSLVIVRHRKRNDSPEGAQQAVQVICPYDWSHEVIDHQRREIRPWIKTTSILLMELDLFRQRPYLEFHSFVHNQSMYSVSLGQLNGVIHYANEPLSGTLQWVGATLMLDPGTQGRGIIRLTLDDNTDIVRMLNVASTFSFTHLTAKLETEPATTPKDYSFHSADVAAEKIKKKYPKLKIEITQAFLNTHYDFDTKFIEDSPKGAYVTLLVEFRNPRSARLTIVDFKLNTSPHVERTTAATPGIIYQNVWVIDKRVEYHNRLTPNLRDDVPIDADREEPVQGWLQFYLDKVKPEQLEGRTTTVILVDSCGEEHECETPELRIEQRTAPKHITG